MTIEVALLVALFAVVLLWTALLVCLCLWVLTALIMTIPLWLISEIVGGVLWAIDTLIARLRELRRK